MKKSSFLVVLILIFMSFNLVSGCYDPDAKFTQKIMGLTINYDTLRALCTEQTCAFDESFITLKSSYNEEVALVFDNLEGLNLGVGFMIKLPYQLNQSCCEEYNEDAQHCYQRSYCLISNTIKPEEYEWERSVKIDLDYLSSLGVIDITSKEIHEISSVSNGTNIRKCSDKWKAIGDCPCEGKCYPADCTSSIYIPNLPEKTMKKETNQETSNNKETISETSMCGDSKCDSNEDSTSCPEDCEQESIKEDKKSSFLIYLTIGIIIVILLIILFLIRAKKS